MSEPEVEFKPRNDHTWKPLYVREGAGSVPLLVAELPEPLRAALAAGAVGGSRRVELEDWGDELRRLCAVQRTAGHHLRQPPQRGRMRLRAQPRAETPAPATATATPAAPPNEEGQPRA